MADFDAKIPSIKDDVEDDKGLVVFHAWSNLIPAFGHKEVTVNDCNDELMYFMQEYDYHFLSWDVNLKICQFADAKLAKDPVSNCEGKNVIGYSRKSGLFDRAIEIFPADDNGDIKKKSILSANKTFWLVDWNPTWEIALKAAPGSHPVLDPKIVSAILANRIFAGISSGGCMTWTTLGWTFLIIFGLMFLGVMICCNPWCKDSTPKDFYDTEEKKSFLPNTDGAPVQKEY